MVANYFQGTKDNPHHLSVGAVVQNDKGEICCHYFGKVMPGSKYGNCENFYLLMRETIEPNETIEECLARGLQEEFGMKATLKRYLGSLDSHWVTKDNVRINKTTLYFLCNPISFDIKNRKEDDSEEMSVIKWMNIKDLITKMKEQEERFGGNTTLDESAILERVV